MIKLIARIGLTAILFSFIFPFLFGANVQFNGNFWPDAIIYAAVFAGVCWLFDVVISFAIKVFAIATLGIGAILVGLFFLFGFWLIPAIQLQVFAHYFPDVFSISGWGSAILAGLVLMFTNWLTAPAKQTNS